ncbi:hypothetical protein CQW23_27247 [Capsicum baccatum]|uniref:BAH domain-containing protein n=1 Tax=Capsicum baccatum TaxID=33114 RepID=A0A2G2VD49_CAPBA|nr:hypothetical protein CQW23_27247 [Capsicum baccatum]
MSEIAKTEDFLQFSMGVSLWITDLEYILFEEMLARQLNFVDFPYLADTPRSDRRSALIACKQIATAKLPNYLKLKVKFPSSGPAGIQLVESQHKLSFEARDNIELLPICSTLGGPSYLIPVAGVRWQISGGIIRDTPASEKKRSASTAGHIYDEGQLPSKSKPKISNILWSGTAWTCAKRLKHYPSFSTKGITITVNSFAIIKAEEEGHYLAYLDDFYENEKGEKSVKVRWFQHLQEVQCVIPQLEGHPGEIFITPHTQVIYAECIDTLATVLTPEDYERYISLAPENLFSGVYMSCWEFKNNKVMPFSVSELDGYYNQTIFTMLSNHQAQLKSKGPMSHEIKDITREDTIKQGPRGSRSVGGSRSSGIRKSIPGNQLAKATPPTCTKLKTKIPSSGPAGIQLVEPQFKLSFEVGDNLEVLRRDSGLRGCWFRCKVLKVSEKCLKVQYDDIQDYDGPHKMKEWVSSYRVADSDKLGMRCTGRLTIRPRPPEDFSDCSFEVGAAVDAWWSDGWWEGVVVDFDVYGSGHLQVFFPAEYRLLEIPKKNVRISRDWIDNKWVEVNGKKDIMSFISSSLNDVSKCSIKEPGNCENQMAPKLVEPEDK